jgi:hypothetical protein
MSIIDILGHVIGFVGMVCVVFAFNKVVSGAWEGTGKEFNVVNLIGATLLLISLLIHFNLGSFIIEVFWIAIALKGLYTLKRSKTVVGPKQAKKPKSFEEKSRKAGIGA